ncbi:hypothetical protein BGX21_000447, partial [Mortierella sp. AD011]
MLRNLFSSQTNNLSPEETLELANKHLELARKEDDIAKRLEVINRAKSLLKDTENIFASKNVKDPTLSEGIANAYHEHGRLLNDLGHHSKAKKSHNKAEKWGYVEVVDRNDGSSHPLGKNDTGKPTPNKDVMQIQQKIFDQNITPPVAKYALPKPNELVTSTPQLAYCLSLLHPSMISVEGLDQSERDWLQDGTIDFDEKERLLKMATDLVRAFAQDELKKPDVVAEVVSLAAVLVPDDFRGLLQAFVDGIDQSMLLETHLLNGFSQLIRNAPQGCVDTDDLVKILKLLNARLKNTHKQSARHTYRLASTISQVLDSMVDCQVKGLSREQLHEPLSDYLKELQQNPDPYLVYQAAYAYQALQYIPDDETILQSMMRRTGKAVQGISGVVSAVKALDLVEFIEGLQDIQQGLTGAEKAIELVSDAYLNAAALAKNGQELLASLKEGFNFKHKGSWYPALRGLDRLVQEGRFADFERLAREAPCQQDPAFRWGVCLRLGEIAANNIWDLKIRKYAFNFLRQLYEDNANNGQQVNIRQWIFCILNQLAESFEDIVEGSADELLQEARANGDSGKGNLYYGYSLVQHHQMVTPPPMKFPLLDRVQNKSDVEAPLLKLRLERLNDRSSNVYISPRAKATPRATDDFDLTAKVHEFLDSDGKVFLLLGNSGAGKSAFCRALEINLWDNYEINGRIPLFIYLPEFERSEQDLIAKKLRKVDFTDRQILELRSYREFILICDGYDESQQIRNLYMSNRLNQPGEWRAKMVISCRAEYCGVDYKDCFRPTDRNGGGDTGQFQEAIISPFNQNQIQDYIEQY